MKSFRNHTLEEAIKYHLTNDVPFYENIFRPFSEMSDALFNEAKRMYNENQYQVHDWFEQELLESDIGEYGIYENERVPLDFPLEEAAEYHGEKVELNKPKRGGAKKFYVYVKNDKGNVVKVQFGDTSGLKAKINDPAARRSFVARQRCADKTDKTTPGYWACRLPHFAQSVGLKGGNKNYFW